MRIHIFLYSIRCSWRDNANFPDEYSNLCSPAWGAVTSRLRSKRFFRLLSAPLILLFQQSPFLVFALLIPMCFRSNLRGHQRLLYHTNFTLMIPFYTPWKDLKTLGFLVILRGCFKYNDQKRFNAAF